MSLSHIPLPSIILSNVQSLWNKTDELQAQARYRHEFRDACILALTETWLSHKDLDKDVTIDGFGKPIRLDRDAVATGKSTGGGLCLFLNERYCDAKSVIIRERLCTADLELLSTSLRPRYLPREFPQVFVTLVYIHPKANEGNACELIHQYVTCPTRQDKIIDLCYGNIKGAYKSIPLPPLGLSDHNCVHLIPAYRSALKRGKVQHIQVKDWSEEACLTLQGCIESTDWDMFTESCSDINELTNVISSWVVYCKDHVIPDKTVKIYPNNKPWVSKSLKMLLHQHRGTSQLAKRHQT
ncbi:hypothetical protein N1851_009244 [Merluccius polli]|uniref:Uncharacterized protein n=1 Tax=Merluccius polli TaxID=89951 RepID=A0AA47N1L0_MERPO|nr:hypothetical protein N1851_009244 [Merluccius polli]